ncbi:10147_t:CDS:10 [Diversispora eburnea]|uniref:10147_t:CDS:1 n=1 Tax=Diversispora eburnea TaxID=1213867 RepID=A0A9N8V5Y6_9GLOM|nr:10147_t:CDS:10 [Diversispora eburnea]
MGFFEKENLSKTPIPINPYWGDLITKYTFNHDTEDLHESVHKIKELIDNPEATWERQCQYLKGIRKCLSLVKEKSLPSKKTKRVTNLTSSPLPSHYLRQLKEIVEPIIFEVYFVSSEQITKRHCIPILESCHMVSSTQVPDGNNGNNGDVTFIKEYSKYITNQYYTTQSFNQKAMTVYLTLEFPIGFSVVRESLFHTIYFFVDCLMQIIQYVSVEASEQNKSTSLNGCTSIKFSQYMNDALQVTKILVTLLSRFNENLRPKFESFIERSENYDNSDVLKTKFIIYNLFKGSLIICSNNLYVKDVRQLAGMMLAATFNLSGSPSFVSEQILEFYKIPYSPGNYFLKRWEIQVSNSLIGELGWTGEEPLMLSVSRGFLSNLSRETLMHPISWNNKTATSALSIIYFCDNALNSQTKVLAFETIGIWLQTTENILKDSDVNFRHITEITSIISLNILEKLISFVWINWDDPVDAIQYKCYHENSVELYKQFQMDLIKNLLSMDPYRKIKYALLILLLPKIESKIILEMQNDFVSCTLEVLHNFTIAPRASQLLLLFFEQSLKEILKSSVHCYDRIIDEQRLSSYDGTLRKNIGEFILKTVFKFESISFWRILSILQNDNISDGFIKDHRYKLHALIMVIKIAKSLDLISGSMFIEVDSSGDEDVKKIHLQHLRDAINHFDSNIRIDLFGLICESKRSTTEVTSIEFSLLKTFLKIAQANSDAIILKGKIENAQEFLNWLIELLSASLFPGASFQRVSSALNLFVLLIKIFGIEDTPLPKGFVEKHNSSNFPFRLPLATPRNSKLILYCLMNRFDENRILAYEILEMFPSPLPGIILLDEVQRILFWALNSMTSTRAGESDSGAMIFRIIFSKYVVKLKYELNVEDESNNLLSDSEEKDPPSILFTKKLLSLLNKQIKIASENLLLASQKYPMHGTFLALQYIFRELDHNYDIMKSNLNEWRQIYDRTINLTEEACLIVLEILSNPSPEGNVPASFQEMEEIIDELILNMESNNNYSEEGGPKHQEAICDIDQIRKVGDLFRTLLTSIRHRGAFSAVYPGYISICSRLLNTQRTQFTELPKIWLKENIDSIKLNSISITRRSAGLPLCILAIVSSEPNNHKVLLPWTMKTLFEIGSEEVPSNDIEQTVDLPQVHAFNILRTIFMNAILGKDILSYVSDGFVLAIKGFSSLSWAIRNCSVMLFSALLQRTFGTKKTKDEHHSINKLTGREFFSRYPALHSFLLGELKVAVDQLINKFNRSEVHPGLYPILTLLSRLHPSLMESTTVLNMVPFVPLVMSCSSSPIYKTREMAARSLVPLIASQDLIKTCSDLSKSCEISNQNELHGRLMQIKFLMNGHLASNVAGFDVMKEQLLCKNTCEITRHLFLEILYEFIFNANWISGEQNEANQKFLLRLMEEHFAKIRQTVFDISFVELFDKNLQRINKNNLRIGSYLVRQQMTKVIIKSLINHESTEFSNRKILEILNEEEYEIRLEDFWKKLYNYIESSKSLSITVTALPLLDLKSIWLEQWTKNIEKNTVPEITLTLREAATKSLQFFCCHLFKDKRFTESSDIHHAKILYLVLARLAQDDDIDIRRSIALMISKVSELKFSVDCDYVRELCYNQIIKQHSNSSQMYFDLFKILLVNEKIDEIFRAEINSSRVLFEIENPNIFKEDLVDVQLTFKSLQNIAIKENMGENVEENIKANDIIEQFHMICEILKSHDIKDKNNDPGPLGFTSHPKMFLIVFKIIASLLLMKGLVRDKAKFTKG